MELQMIAEQNELKVTLEDIKKVKMEKEEPIVLFLHSNLKLKQDILNLKKDKDKNEKPTIEPHALALILSIKYFIDYYDEHWETEVVEIKKLKNFINQNLTLLKDELFFKGFSVELTEKDIPTANQIIDALSVKFYQTILYIMTNYFNDKEQVIAVTPNEKDNSYTFTYRNMNIIELAKLKKIREKK